MYLRVYPHFEKQQRILKHTCIAILTLLLHHPTIEILVIKNYITIPHNDERRFPLQHKNC